MVPNQQLPPFQPNQTPGMYGAPPQPTEKPGSHLPILPVVIGVISGLVLLLVVILVVAFPSDTKPKTTETSEVSQPQGPQPASAIIIEQTNNSISQDISTHNDDRELPATMLDDKSLGL